MTDQKTYAILPRPHYSDGAIECGAVQPEQIEFIRRWRNANMDVLRQAKPISAAQQATYFDQNVWPQMALRQPSQILLSISQSGRLIGYGGLTHISWDYARAEVSFLLDPDFSGSDTSSAPIFHGFLRLLIQMAFEDLGLNRLIAETYANRDPILQELADAGFVQEGRLREHVRVDGQPCDSIYYALLRSDL